MDVTGSIRTLLAVALLAAACAPTSTYRSPPDTSFTKADAALEIENITTTIHTAAVTPAFFPATGGTPLLGRRFTDADYTGVPVVVLSSRLWESKFAKDQAIIGRTIRVDGRNATIVGVMPDGFQIPDATDVWRPQSPR